MNCPRKELNKTYYFKYEGGGGRKRKAVEERKGRRYKEGDRMVEGGIFLGESISGKKNFIEEETKEGDEIGRK